MRARGANALLHTVFEVTPGIVPAGGPDWHKQPFVSSMLGEERGLIESDLLGLGREPSDPTADVATNAGDLVVPVDRDNFGRWLKLFFGNPVSTIVGDNRQHVFSSGAIALPSMTIETGHPELATGFSKHYGARGNTMKIAMSRSGLLNATLGLIAIGEAEPSIATAAGVAPTVLGVTRFAQATGNITKDGANIAAVTAAEFTFSNQLDPVETIKADGRIEDSDPGMCMMSGQITVRFQDFSLVALATSGTPVALGFGWSIGDNNLVFNVPRVFLPLTKRPIEGPRGIQATFNWQASGSGGDTCIATLVNDVAAY